MGFVFIEANVKKWGLAPMTGSLAPPPPYGSEQGSILLETGRDGVRQPEYQPGHSRTRSGLARLGLPTGNPGPVSTQTDISLAHLAHISPQDLSHIGADMGDVQHQPVENTPAGQQIIPPPEYSSPDASPRSSTDDEEQRLTTLRNSSHNHPPIPTYDAAMAGSSSSR